MPELDPSLESRHQFTTILSLSQHGLDVNGGETGIADVVIDQASGLELVTAGLRVQPSIGRLLVFSSGTENMHEMLPLTHGRRVAVQMWFACEGMNPGWARPQREAWHAIHGWGGPDPREDPNRHVNQAPPAPIEWPSPWPWRQTRQ